MLFGTQKKSIALCNSNIRPRINIFNWHCAFITNYFHQYSIYDLFYTLYNQLYLQQKKAISIFCWEKKSAQRLILYSPEHRLASRPEKRGTIIESLCTKVETGQTQNVTAGSRFEVWTNTANLYWKLNIRLQTIRVLQGSFKKQECLKDTDDHYKD